METVKNYVNYNPDTGKLTWVKSPSRRAKVGQEISSVDAYGYLVATFRKKRWKAHRLAWYLYYGEEPEGDIDHINGDRADNRLCNLRVATRADNLRNMKVSGLGSSKFKGVSWSKCVGKWTAQITLGNKKKHLGCFESEVDAARTYDEAAKELYGKFAKLNFQEKV